MKRNIIFLSLLLVLVCSMSGWSMWVDEITEGEWVYFNVGSFSPSGGPISYQTLSDICASCNQNIVDHNFDKMYPFYDYPSHIFVAEIVTLGSYSTPRYVIRLRDTSSNPISPLYFVDSHLYYVYAVDDTKNDHILGPLYDLLYDALPAIIDYTDGLEHSLSTISSRINTAGNRLLKTVNGVSYSAADLLYNSWSQLQTIGGYVDGVESTLTSIQNRLLKESDGVRYTAADLLFNSWRQLQTIGGYVDNVEDKLTTQSNLLSSLNTNVSSLLNAVSEDHFVIGYLSDSDGNSFPVQLIPSGSADDIISYLNSQYQGKTILYLSRDGLSSYSVILNRAWLTSDRYIAVSARSSPSSSSYTYYLCDPSNVIFKVSDDNYNDELAQLLSALENVSVNINNSSSSSTTNITTLVTPITTMVTTTANINTKLDSLVGKLDINIGSIVDHLDLGFGDVVDAIQALPSSNVSALIPYVDQLEPYTDDIERLLTYNNTSLTNLSLYTDDLEDLVTTSNSSLSNISSYSEDISSYCDSILQTNQAILAHLDSSDLVDDVAISYLVKDWGDHLVYTVLNSDNVLSLFNAAFGDLPSDLEWGQARMFFEQFYRGDE